MRQKFSVRKVLAAAGIAGGLMVSPALAEFPDKGMTLIVAYVGHHYRRGTQVVSAFGAGRHRAYGGVFSASRA